MPPPGFDESAGMQADACVTYGRVVWPKCVRSGGRVDTEWRIA